MQSLKIIYLLFLNAQIFGIGLIVVRAWWLSALLVGSYLLNTCIVFGFLQYSAIVFGVCIGIHITLFLVSSYKVIQMRNRSVEPKSLLFAHLVLLLLILCEPDISVRFGVSNNYSGLSNVPTIVPGDTLFFSRNDVVDIGDMISFDHSSSPHLPKFRYVKRIVASQGDLVELAGKKLYINRALVATESQLPLVHSSKYFKKTRKNTWLAVVPEGKFFVLGDNHDWSYDSRHWMQPFVDSKSIGKTIRYVLWSTNSIGRIGQQI